MSKGTNEAGSSNLDEYRTQWHMALAPAMKLELMDYSGILKYEPEHVLNTKALQIDLLIIKKDRDTIIENEIGRIFHRYNIIEYKSPHDSEGVDEYLKTHAYASLYKINEGSGNASYDMNDITITMIREGRPVKLLKWLEQQGGRIEEKYKGIYYIQHFTTF